MYNLIYKRISKSYFLLVVVGLLFTCGTAFAQETTSTSQSGFSGMVIDQYDRPVSGVEISVKKTNQKTHTDLDGIFNMEHMAGATLVLSHPDYLVKEIKVPRDLKEDKVFKIGLNDKKFKNPDTIDIPYRGTVSKDSYLGAATTLYTEELGTTLSTNILGNMAGRIPGLNITQNHGMRKQMSDIASTAGILIWVPNMDKGGYNDNNMQYGYSLRGATTPTVIIDGFESELLNIDPESIESVSIQKDALSSMFLGGKSSRGVMYITTKKPVAEGFRLSFTGKYGVQKPINMPNPLSAQNYAALLNEALINDGKTPMYTNEDLEKFRTGSNPISHPTVDWYDQILKNNSPIQSYNLNATGGGKTAQFFVSLGYMGEDGLFKQTSDDFKTNSKYERYMITSKINVNVMPGLKMSASVIGRIEDERQPGGKTSDLLNEVYRLPSIAYPVLNENGSYAGVNAYGTKNLYAETVASGYRLAKARDGLANIKLEHDMSWLLEGLSGRILGSVSTQSRSAIERNKTEPIYEYIPVGNYYEEWASYKPQRNEFIPVYNYQYMFGQIGFDYVKNINGIHNISASINADMREVLDNFQLPEYTANIYAEGKYDYKNKYFAQAAINRSHLNRFAPGRRWGTFYAFGLGWDITREDFMSEVDWINKLKLRGTFGETGNGINRNEYYIWRQSYNNSGDFGYSQGSGYTNLDGVIEKDNRLVNERISWERAHKLNLGFDASLLNNNLWITADFYRDMYYDLRIGRGKSIELIGLDYPSENIGKNLFKGIDFSVTYQNNIADFNYFVTANWSIVKSKVVYKDEQDQPYEYMRQTGKPVNARYGFVVDGFYQSQEEVDDPNNARRIGQTPIPGDFKYRDLNGDGVIDDYDKQIIGNDKPIGTFGLNLGFSFKGFEVSAFFQGVYNRDISLRDASNYNAFGVIDYGYTGAFRAGRDGYNQAYDFMMNRWTPETASTALFPRLTTSSLYNDTDNSFWIKSGNYIRLKNIQIAYTFPDTFSRNYLGGMKIKLFVTGQNLWTQAACELVDPEVINFTNYPILKGFNTGINIKF